MKIKHMRPMLWTNDFDGTIDFYTERLAFTLLARMDEYPWASLKLDNSGVMISGPNAHTPHKEIGFTGSFYFNTDDVEACWAELKDKARVCYDIETFPWGMREFAVYDNNGYILQFGQEVESE